MKKIIPIIIVLTLVIGGIIFWQIRLEKIIPSENEKEANNKDLEIFCPDYDGNQQKCLSYSECEWASEENDCNLIGSVDEEENNDEKFDDEEFDDEEEPNQELEAITIPENLSNELCKKIPLSDQLPYSGRYQCLALVNHDERFCEGADEEKEKLLCLAFAKKDSSYCELVPQESKHLCYYKLAVSSKNINFCDGVDYLDTAQGNKDERLNCYMNYITNLYAWNKSNEIKTEYCNEFPIDYEDRNTCFALKERDVSLCGNTANCLTFFKQDLSFCNENPELPGCLNDRAKTSKDVSICELLPQPDRDNCVGSYCTHTELDVNICDTIIDIKERQSRYIELSMNLANW